MYFFIFNILFLVNQYNGMFKLLESFEKIYLESSLKEYCSPRPLNTLFKTGYVLFVFDNNIH